MATYYSKHNKKSLRKFISLEKKQKKIQDKVNLINRELKEVKNSIPYPIFVRGKWNGDLIAYLSPRKSIMIKKENSPSSYSYNYTIKVIDLDAPSVDKFSRNQGIQIENLSERITKKEFMETYNEATSFIKELMLYSKRTKKELICEKLIKEQEVR